MGKKGSWFSAIKRVFIPTSKDKLVDVLDKKDAKEKKKKGEGKLKHGNSLIPLFREPSTIEQILGEAEREHHLIDYRPISPFEQPRTPSFIPSRASTPLQHATSQWTPSPQMVASTPPTSSSRRAVSPPRGATPQRVTSPSKGSTSQRMFSAPKVATPQRTVSTSQAATPSNAAAIPSRSASSRYVNRPRPEPTLRYQHMCATRIQAAYRGYAARRSYRALRGLVRLQGVVKGQNVKRQTANAMKCMQLLVRVQTQIQSRRIQMLESQATQQRQQNDKDLESGNGKWSMGQQTENGNADEWDDSRLTKEEIEARMQRKFEAVMKRERAMAYAYSHQLWKASPKTPQAGPMDIRSSGGIPWWSNWLDRSERNPSTAPTKPSESQAIKNLFTTPPRQTGASPLIPRASNYSQQSPGFDHFDSATPRSTRSVAVPSRTKQSPTTPARLPSNNKTTRPRATNANHSPFGTHFKDDDSLTSCPPFSVPPKYMEQTLSAKAKARSGFEASPDVQPKKQSSFPLSQGIGSFKWSKRGSLFSTTATPNREKVFDKKQSLQSTGNMSVDSTVSMPATVGRKPFNRYV